MFQIKLQTSQEEYEVFKEISFYNLLELLDWILFLKNHKITYRVGFRFF